MATIRKTKKPRSKYINPRNGISTHFDECRFQPNTRIPSFQTCSERVPNAYAKIAVLVTCGKCGRGDKLSKSGGQVKKYRDSPSDGYQGVIVVKAGQRFKCGRRRLTFRQKVDAFDPNPRRLMTSRCVRWIRDRCLIDTFKHVAEHIGHVSKKPGN